MIIRIDNNRNSSNLASKCYLNISTSISGGMSKHAICNVYVPCDNCSQKIDSFYAKQETRLKIARSECHRRNFFIPKLDGKR